MARRIPLSTVLLPAKYLSFLGTNDDLLRFVVTAAHCIEGDAYGWEVSIKNTNDQLLMTNDQ